MMSATHTKIPKVGSLVILFLDSEHLKRGEKMLGNGLGTMRC